MKYTFFTLILSCLLLTTSAFGQAKKDSTLVPFDFDLKYVGSNFHVDLNYQYVIDSLITLMHSDSALRIQIRGHVCCGPSYRLSKRRAKKVYLILKRSGIDPKHMSYKGYSDSLPLNFPEKTKEDEAKNRRVDFIIYRFRP